MEFLNAFTFSNEKNRTITPKSRSKKIFITFPTSKELDEKHFFFYHEFFSVLLKLNFFRILSI